MPYDDGKRIKTHQQKLADADLQEQMEQHYPQGTHYPSPPPPDFEPGRIRNEAFFRKMYGGSSEEVQKHLTSIVWLPSMSGQRVRVTTINRVHERLQAVSNELEQLPKSLKRFVDKPAGAFNWRVIAAEKRLSPHSFGIAFDINVPTGDYWLWNASAAREPSAYRNRIPIEIVLIFEKHGFIWGGKWHHYDTLHFEYRPEFLD
jgi:peptidoglycan LD-endopeptidase CwlK